MGLLPKKRRMLIIPEWSELDNAKRMKVMSFLEQSGIYAEYRDEFIKG